MSAAERLRAAAAEVADLRARPATNSAVRSRHRSLRRWQAARLAETHADLLASARYAAPTRFFLDELYGVKDFSQRDGELARVIPTLIRLLPEAALQTLADAVELDALSERLDARMAQALADDPACPADGIDEAAYIRAFRTVGEWADRDAQIDRVEQVGQALDRLVRHPLLGRLLSAMEGPARLAGLSAMQAFLASGFQAFKTMGGAQVFLDTVLTRERALMARLQSSDPDPFDRRSKHSGRTGQTR